VALRGWAIPAATDIAFAIGIVMLLGRGCRLAEGLPDRGGHHRRPGGDRGHRVFYTAQLSLPCWGRGGLPGAAGAAQPGRCAPGRSLHRDRPGDVGLRAEVGRARHAGRRGDGAVHPSDGEDGHSPAEALEHGLHPWVAFLVLPMFAFANAGVSLAGLSWSDLLQPVSLGITAGLLVGKTLGVFGCVWAMVRLGWASAPAGASWARSSA
jgi:NhaA family Na+:H+ antiporter